LPVFEELYSDSILAKQGTIRLVELGNFESFAREALKALDLYEIRHKRVSESSLLLSPLTAEGKKNISTTTAISVLKLGEEEKQERRSESQSWEDVAAKVVKVLSELI
jgi:hypothetical protein